MSDSIELTQVWLGVRPYVLVEAKMGPDGEDDLRIVVSYGGGPETFEDAAGMLALALTELPGGFAAMHTAIEEFEGLD